MLLAPFFIDNNYLCLGSIILDCDFRELFVGTFGAVASDVAFGDGIGHWALGNMYAFGALCRLVRVKCYALNAKRESVAKQRNPKLFTIHHSPFTRRIIGGRASALHCAGMNSRFQKKALRSNTPKPFLIKPKICISQRFICIDHRRHGRSKRMLNAPSGCACASLRHPYTPSIDTSEAFSTAKFGLKIRY